MPKSTNPFTGRSGRKLDPKKYFPSPRDRNHLTISDRLFGIYLGRLLLSGTQIRADLVRRMAQDPKVFREVTSLNFSRVVVWSESERQARALLEALDDVSKPWKAKEAILGHKRLIVAEQLGGKDRIWTTLPFSAAEVAGGFRDKFHLGKARGEAYELRERLLKLRQAGLTVNPVGVVWGLKPDQLPLDYLDELYAGKSYTTNMDTPARGQARRYSSKEARDLGIPVPVTRSEWDQLKPRQQKLLLEYLTPSLQREIEAHYRRRDEALMAGEDYGGGQRRTMHRPEDVKRLAAGGRPFIYRLGTSHEIDERQGSPTYGTIISKRYPRGGVEYESYAYGGENRWGKRDYEGNLDLRDDTHEVNRAYRRHLGQQRREERLRDQEEKSRHHFTRSVTQYIRREVMAYARGRESQFLKNLQAAGPERLTNAKKLELYNQVIASLSSREIREFAQKGFFKYLSDRLELDPRHVPGTAFRNFLIPDKAQGGVSKPSIGPWMVHSKVWEKIMGARTRAELLEIYDPGAHELGIESASLMNRLYFNLGPSTPIRWGHTSNQEINDFIKEMRGQEQLKKREATGPQVESLTELFWQRHALLANEGDMPDDLTPEEKEGAVDAYGNLYGPKYKAQGPAKGKFSKPNMEGAEVSEYTPAGWKGVAEEVGEEEEFRKAEADFWGTEGDALQEKLNAELQRSRAADPERLNKRLQEMREDSMG